MPHVYSVLRMSTAPVYLPDCRCPRAPLIQHWQRICRASCWICRYITQHLALHPFLTVLSRIQAFTYAADLLYSAHTSMRLLSAEDEQGDGCAVPHAVHKQCRQRAAAGEAVTVRCALCACCSKLDFADAVHPIVTMCRYCWYLHLHDACMCCHRKVEQVTEEADHLRTAYDRHLSRERRCCGHNLSMHAVAKPKS
jgi:hypothetical protein